MLSFKKGDKHVHAMLHIYLLVNIVFHWSSPGNNCILSIDLPEATWYTVCMCGTISILYTIDQNNV
jgi:hypothetical protein